MFLHLWFLKQWIICNWKHVWQNEWWVPWREAEVHLHELVFILIQLSVELVKSPPVVVLEGTLVNEVEKAILYGEENLQQNK